MTASISNSGSELRCRQLGLQAYRQVWQEMQAFTDERDETTIDELWFVEHPPVFTLGQASKPEHLLATGDIEIVQADRGGQVTYHGPGQQVVYLMVDLRRKQLGVRALVERIENAVVKTLASYDIEARPRADAPGVYVGERKICSLGLRIRRGCSFHGLALNIDMDLEPFRRINPCGYAGMEMVQMKDFCPGVNMADVAPVLERELKSALSKSD